MRRRHTRGHENGLRPKLGTWTLLLWLVGLPGLILATGLLWPWDERLSLLLVFLFALVSSRGTLRQTVVVVVWVTAFIALSLLADQHWGVLATVEAVLLSALLGLWSVLSCRRRIEHENKIHRLRSAAAALQRQILRPLPLRTPHLTVDGRYEPVEEDSRVGGDVYEVVESPYGSRVLIADVQGKGLPAIGLALVVLGAFREAAYWRQSLIEVVDALEHAVIRHNSLVAQSGEPERFVTALILEVGDAPEARAVNCGHIPPYLLDGAGARKILSREPALPLGLGHLTAEPRIAERFGFPPGTTLVLCTDGVTEAQDPSGAFYPLGDRLRHREDPAPDQVTKALYAELRQHTKGRFRDDVTVLALRRQPAVVASGSTRL